MKNHLVLKGKCCHITTGVVHILVLSVMETVAVTGEARPLVVADTVKFSTDSRLLSGWMVIFTQTRLMLASNIRFVADSAV